MSLTQDGVCCAVAGRGSRCTVDKCDNPSAAARRSPCFLLKKGGK
jgi:hypothetical protein